MIYKCIKCEQTSPDINALYTLCKKCGHLSHKIDGIPVLLEDFEIYISKKLIQYKLGIDDLNTQKETFSKLNNDEITAEIDRRIALFNEFKNQLTPHGRIDAVINAVSSHSHTGYSLSYEYLLRDWSGLKECEDEIKIIVDALKSKLTPKHSNALVLGAGLGRIALELKDCFNHLIAIDLSYEMPALLQKISKQPYSFTYYLKKNYSTPTNTLLHIAIKEELVRKLLQNKTGTLFDYFVADVKNLPLSNHTVDCIISCYFTDTLAIQDYFSEIDRVLSTGGSFIHFGPLDYHFTDPIHQLSLQELHEYFKSKGYKIESYTPLFMEHITLNINAKKTIYKNWFFKAIKTSSLETLKNSDVLLIPTEIQIQINASLPNNDDTPAIKEVVLSSPRLKTFECTLDTVNVLQKINGIRTVSEIFNELEQEYALDQETYNNTLLLLTDFVNKGYIIKLNPKSTCET
ncbi:methyltransferase domain-containing protein [Flavobacterium sp. NKUCC04_CG]|uniref:methyltransferase domain-containing protein n=1 Tax=Flavobacterium sp. NKUCC04_CG TaxID=2842121 RepID=UPI001C5BA3F3|nr:methyltransferase domain-containing protein [Flavobacterium sp. NKUCC04_CG]MBW3518969.1 carnosine N-methyltransferase family protein [Flavobacterium sp. NKUCC04_CG]